MRYRRIMAMIMALALCLTAARAEEYLVGMSAEEVRRLETRLHELGYLAAEADTAYDADTRQAIEVFQQANGLQVTGELDADTSALLEGDGAVSRQDYLRRFAQAYQAMEPLKKGDINNQVQVMQRKLGEYGYFSGSGDGVFGDATQTAVERFQMVNGLSVTGVADGMTLMRLMADVPITWQGYLSEMSCAAGDVGLNVYVLQKKLAEMGDFEGECTGSFGDLTQKAVAQFQGDNGLEPTGIADAALWELIYSGSAAVRRRADVPQRGDSGEKIARAQDRLNALGYLGGEATGDFDYATETAVRLFQMGNGLPATGRLGGDTLVALLGDAALPANSPDVQAAFAQRIAGRDSGVQARIAEIAAGMVGVEFQAPDDALYPGFALVQYVCVAAGLPITAPEALIRLADDPVERPEEVAAGNIVAFQTAESDSVTMLLTVGAGEGRIIYATPQIGWVVMSYISQIESASAYRWAEPSA